MRMKNAYNNNEKTKNNIFLMIDKKCRTLIRIKQIFKNKSLKFLCCTNKFSLTLGMLSKNNKIKCAFFIYLSNASKCCNASSFLPSNIIKSNYYY